MPLIQSSSKEAREKNIETELHAHKNMDPKQAVAIGYATQRANASRDDMGEGSTSVPFQALAPGVSSQAVSQDSPEEEAIGRETMTLHEHLHKHMHQHEHHHAHHGESSFGEDSGIKFPYAEGSHVGGAEDTAACTEVASHKSMEDAIRQMYEPESERGENANGIVTPR